MGKIIVVGAGPSGMLSAISASKKHDVILIEKNNELGKKLKITGGGRCNITNKRDIEEFFEKIVTNPKFLYSSFYNFTNEDLLSYFKKNKLKYKVEEDNKVYPEEDKSTQVIDILRSDLIKNNVNILYQRSVRDLIIEDNKIKGVKLDNDDILKCDKVIIATGGRSYPKTGSSGEIFNILEKYGHNIKELYPALIPLTVKENWVKSLQGISLQDITIYCKIKNKKISINGDILFAHFGITGPAVLNISSYITKHLKKQNIELVLDLIPNISKEKLSNMLKSSISKNVQNNLKGILTQNFIKQVFCNLGINDKKASELTKIEEKSIIESLKEMKLTCIGTRSIDEAIITSGGVDTKEINSSNMESKVIKGLFFCGEAIDIDAQTGGYNLQIAFSTGYLAGTSV